MPNNKDNEKRKTVRVVFVHINKLSGETKSQPPSVLDTRCNYRKAHTLRAINIPYAAYEINHTLGKLYFVSLKTYMILL